MKKSPEFIIAIGASAGGTTALAELVAQFDTNIDAAIFIVLHLSDTAIGELLQQRLQKHTKMPCLLGRDKEEIQKGHIYIAVPDYHLILKRNIIRVIKGPIENRWRPSINVLFRSAAVSYNSHAIAIELTGLLDDGTSGMIAIKKCGGTTIVQDPNEAEFPDMPLSVLNTIDVNYCVPLARMGSVVTSIINGTDRKSVLVPDEIKLESEIVENEITNVDTINQLGKRSSYACPDCGGCLWEIEEKEGKICYRCHVGHSYSTKDLLLKQNEHIESSLWVALRMMEERASLLKRIGGDNKAKGLKMLAEGHLKREKELAGHIRQLKDILFAKK